MHVLSVLNRFTLLVALSSVALGSCHLSATSSSSDNTVSYQQEEAASAKKVETSQSPAAQPQPAHPTPPASSSSPAAPTPPTPPKPKSIEQPKPETVLSGCLTNPAARSGGGTRATPGPERSQREGVSIAALGENIEVTYRLTHNCCHQAAVETSAGQGNRIEVVVKLSGNDCRCMCSSTVKTTIPAEKGKTYTVDVIYDKNGTQSKVHSQEIAL